MTKPFKQKRSADAFAKKLRSKGLFASVFAEPVDPHAATRRKRQQMRYYVEYESGRALMNPHRRSAREKSLIRRKATAVKKILKIFNPSRKVNAVRLKRLKGGGVTIIPIKIKVKGRRSAA